MQSQGKEDQRSNARTLLGAPGVSSVVAPHYGRTFVFFGLVGIFSLVIAFFGLRVFITAPLVTGASDGPLRGYDFGHLLGLLVWMVFGPLAVAAGLGAWLFAHKSPGATRGQRVSMAVVVLAMSMCCGALGYVWLEGRQMLECGYVWCYAAEASTVDPIGFLAEVGSTVVGINVLVAAVSIVVLLRTAVCPTTPDQQSVQQRIGDVFNPDLAWAKAQDAMRAQVLRRRMAAVGLLTALPVLLILAGILPNTWERFSRVTDPGPIHSMKYYMAATCGIDGDLQSEEPNAWMVTHNWRINDDIVVKLFPDTVLFYGFLELVVFVTALAAEIPALSSLLSRKLGGVTLGRIALGGSFFVFLSLFISYWAHDHLFHGDGKYDKYPLDCWARVFGIVAIMSMGLLLLPASKSSPLLAAAGVSWESALWAHITMACLFIGSALLHVALYFARFVQLGYGRDILPFNAGFWYPQNPVGGPVPSDNFTVPMMSTVFWPSLVCFAVLPWFRRTRWELFRYSHNMFLILVPATLWHASNAWVFIIPGAIFWLLDRAARFLDAAELVNVEQLVPHNVECWTDPRPGVPPKSIAEKVTKVGFTWPGQGRMHSPGMYVLVNFPQVSAAEWHPFSLSSSPMDSVASLHVKNMGDGSFTGKLHDLASKAGRGGVVMNVQGPYGPRVDLHDTSTAERVVLVAGGIGVTPMLSALRCAIQRDRVGRLGKLKRIRLVWSSRSPAVFDILQEELSLQAGGSLDVELSLFCSTASGTATCAAGPVRSGIPNFTAILAEETAQGDHCLVRVCGPPPMVTACANASKACSGSVDFEPWSFVL